ncbi:hypothetical protein [Desulfovibrio litoralis]|uniref:Ankyrin repeat-containing protein n=1 Tax=Desulfovibrio litoralis DSM 11393 TaxID=1121455 RepID=A0A1M7TMP6_9BACT|nr:hypothetical protein [Desulfovibrio litoralis]SHN72004.1 hypothetical protein SAMN02745728_02267 [Desulfovibrio litoralis DSM 11393]
MLKRITLLILVLLSNFLFSISAFAMSSQEFLDLCAKGSLAEVKKAIANGADVNAIDVNPNEGKGIATREYLGQTALMFALGNKDLAVLNS